MGESPLVSVIIPARDAQATLARAVASVRAQTYTSVEVVVVDDASEDQGRACRECAPDRLVLRETSAGPGAARNAGVAAANGSLLAFLDADDWWLPEKLQAYLEHLQGTGNDLAVGYFRYELEGVAVPAGFNPALLNGEHLGRIPSALVVRRRAFAALGGFDETRMTAEDVEWFGRVARAGLSPSVVPGVHLVKSVSGRNLSLRHSSARRDLFEVLTANLRARRSRTAAEPVGE